MPTTSNQSCDYLLHAKCNIVGARVYYCITYYITTAFLSDKSIVHSSPDPLPIFEGGVRLHQTMVYTGFG